MLRGKRVVLRVMERDDLQRWNELMNIVDLVLLGHGNWQPTALAGRQHWFDNVRDTNNEAWFLIEADGKVIGEAGLHYWRWNRRAGVSEFGIGIYDRDYLGKGYGPDVANVLLTWAFEVQNFRRIWLRTWASNARAIRAYAKLGFREEGRLRQQIYVENDYVDEVVMGLLRSEWGNRKDEG